MSNATASEGSEESAGVLCRRKALLLRDMLERNFLSSSRVCVR